MLAFPAPTCVVAHPLPAIALALGVREASSRVRRVAVAALVSVLACGLAVDDVAAQSATVTLTSAPTSLSEDDATATDVTVTATVSSVQASNTVVTLSLAGTATRETDYMVSPSLPRITIPAGQTEASAILVLTPVDDTFWEGREFIEVNGRAANNLTVQGASLPLNDNEDRPSISLLFSPSYSYSDFEIAEESATPVSYTLHAELSSGATLETDTPITLFLDTNAVKGTDYTVTDPLPTITLRAGKTTESVVIVLTTIDNSVAGDWKYFFVAGTATDHRGEPFGVSGTARFIIIVDDERRDSIRSISLTVELDVVREQDLVSNQGVDLTVTASLDGGAPLDSPVIINQTLIARCGVFADSNLPDLTIPAGSTLRVQQSVRLQSVANPAISEECIARLSGSSSSYGSDTVNIRVIPDEAARIVSASITKNSATSTRPHNIASEGDTIRFRFVFNRSFRVKDLGNTRGRVTLSFQLGDESRTTECGTGIYNGVMSCFYKVAAGDLDLDGLSLAPDALTITGSTVDYYDESILVTVNTMIPQEYLGIGSHLMVHGTPRSFELLASVESVQEGVGPIELRVTATLSAGLEGTADISIPIVFTGGTPTAAGPEDYTVSSGPHAITVRAGDLSGSTTLTFTPVDDRLLEARTEIVRIEGGTSSDYFVLRTDLALIDATTIQLSATPSSIREEGGPAFVFVTAELGDPNDQTRPRPIPISLTLSGSAGSSDYTVTEDLIVTIPANTGSVTTRFTFTPVDDRLYEGDETIVIIGSTDVLAVLGTPTITLLDNESNPAIILGVSDPTILESDTSATQVTVSVALDSDEALRQSDTVVALSLTGTATAGANGDFTAAWNPQTQQITIPQGQRAVEATLTLTPLQDLLAEGDETIVVEGTATGDLVVQVATITLVDDDDPGLELDPTVLEVTEGQTAIYTVALTFEPTEPVTVTMTTDLAETDLSVDTTVLRFEPDVWNQEQTVNVTAARDTDTFADDSVTLVHEASGGAYDDVTSAVTVTIKENDVPIVTLSGLSVADSAGREEDGPIEFTVTLAQASLETVTVQYATSDGTATEGVDYTRVQGTLTFDPGDKEETVSVAVTNDMLDEDDEDFTLTLSGETNASLGKSVATGRITDDDPEPEVGLAVMVASAAEGESMSFEVQLGAASGKTVTVEYATASGTATQGTDYSAASGKLTFSPGGARSQTIVVATTEDALDEAAEEDFTLTLRNARNASLGTSVATGMITDDDELEARVSAYAVNVVEGNTATFTVEVTGGTSTAPVEVRYAVTGTATAVDDYTAPSGTLTIAARASTGTISIATAADNVQDAGETLVVALSGASTDGRTVTVDTASVETSIADVGTVTVSVTAVATSVREGAMAEFEVELSGAVAAEVTVDWTTVDGTATSVQDYVTGSGSLTFLEGERSKTVSVPTIDDRVDEPLKSFEVSLTGRSLPSGVLLGRANAGVMIEDDDTRGVTVSRSELRILEGLTGTYTVALTSQPTGTVTVTATVTGDDDVTVNPRSLTFPTANWSTQQMVTVKAAQDLDAIVDEATVLHTLRGGDYGTVPVGEEPVRVGAVAVTVHDDEAPAKMVILTVDPHRISEDAGETTVTVTATLDGSRLEGAEVVVVVSDGTAKAPADYTVVPNTFSVMIPAGQSSGTGTFTLTPQLEAGGGQAECDETLTVGGTVTSGTGPPLTLVPTTLTLTDPARDLALCSMPRPPTITRPGGISGSGSEPETGDPEEGTRRSLRDEVLPPLPQISPLAPTRAKLAIWTDLLGYRTGQTLRLYRSTDPMGDESEYSFFYYLENIGTGERRYFAPELRSPALRAEVIDHLGRREGSYLAGPIESVERELIWTGTVAEPGLWHFVFELRNPYTTQEVKSVYAKFVVSANQPAVLGGDGSVKEIAMDETWTSDTIYKLQHQVFVNAGATLTIEAGTLIQGRGPNAMIVVERGGRIVAEGRREAPVVLTCDAPVGQRETGCWGGLIVLGNAPADGDADLLPDVVPESRAVYGGDDRNDSNGTLRYVRVEFAGGGSNAAVRPAAFGFHGVGSNTVIDHVQAHVSLGDGILFRGGTAHCGYCVSSGARDDSLEWSQGWLGTAQHVYIQQGPLGDRGIDASGAGVGLNLLASMRPALYNVTLVGGAMLGGEASSGDGIRLEAGAAVMARNIVLTKFGGFALAAGSVAAGLFVNGQSGLRNAILHANGNRNGEAQVVGGVGPYINFLDTLPMLRNTRYEANPDPRPMHGSHALKVGAAAVPPSDGTLSRHPQYVGAFGARNWLEEWTFFGAESDYYVGESPE